jgi:hypothetical protein
MNANRNGLCWCDGTNCVALLQGDSARVLCVHLVLKSSD